MNLIEDLYMSAHAARWMDGQVTVDGNDYDPSAVIQTLDFVFRLYLKTCLPDNITREHVEAWLIANNRADEAEYLMEE